MILEHLDQNIILDDILESISLYVKLMKRHFPNVLQRSFQYPNIFSYRVISIFELICPLCNTSVIVSTISYIDITLVGI